MHNALSIIERKRDGGELSAEEIRAAVNGFTRGEMHDYQMSALAMAICCRGMTAEETYELTAAMLASGRSLQRSGELPRVDKHSTGGLGDKISLVLAPLLACCSLHVPMLSGRALGITGGTLDKLEAIPGYRTDLSLPEIELRLDNVGCVITGTTPEIVPADRKLYALRDVSGTVPSVPLITASIMSKKLAESLDALTLDVKFGSGAFMRTREDAARLAESLIAVGKRFGVATTATLNDMNFPTGEAIGNLNEVLEAIAVLQGGGPADVRTLTIELAANLMIDSGREASRERAKMCLAELIGAGAAYERFERMIAGQGGRLKDLPHPAAPHPLAAEHPGRLIEVDCYRVGMAVIALGGGRTAVGQAIDHRVGLQMTVRPGEAVAQGQPLCQILCDDPRRLEQARGWLAGAFRVDA